MNQTIALTEKQLDEIRSLRHYLIDTSKIPDIMVDYVGVPLTTMGRMLPNAMFGMYGMFLVWV